MTATARPIDWERPIEVAFNDSEEWKPARFLCELKGGGFAVAVNDAMGCEQAYSFNRLGTAYGAIVRNTPRTLVKFYNVYPNGEFWAYDSRKSADDAAGTARIACVKVIAKEGQFDE